jgi:hypothetical protein
LDREFPERDVRVAPKARSSQETVKGETKPRDPGEMGEEQKRKKCPGR